MFIGHSFEGTKERRETDRNSRRRGKERREM